MEPSKHAGYLLVILFFLSTNRVFGSLNSGFTVENLLGRMWTPAIITAPPTHTLNLSRISLEIWGEIINRISIRTIYQLEYILSDSSLVEFERSKTEEKEDWIDTEYRILSGSRYLLRHRLHRVYLDIDIQPLDIRIGKQKLDWEVANFFPLTNPFTPKNEFRVEPGQVSGMDIFYTRLFLGGFSSIEFAYSPGYGEGEKTFSRFRTSSFKNLDASILFGGDSNDYLFAGNFALSIFDGILTGECKFYIDSLKPDLLVGYTRSFPNSIFWEVEFLHRESLPQYMGEAIYLSGDSYLAFSVEKLWRVLWDIRFSSVINLKDKSFGLIPILSYSISEDIDLRFGAFIWNGSEDTEFSLFSNSYFLRISLYL